MGTDAGGAMSSRSAAAAVVVCCLAGCSPKAAQVELVPSTRPAEPAGVLYDTTAAKPVPPRDRLERSAQERGRDLELVDRLMDERTRVPDFDREPLPPLPDDARIADGVQVLEDEEPFPEPVPLPPKDVTIRVGVARSTYRTRTRPEVLSAVQPFIDLVQREVNIRGEPTLYESPEAIYFGLLDGTDQMAISQVFDYLLVRSWFENVDDNATVLLGWAAPAHPRTGELDRDFAGVPGTSIELIVARDSPYDRPAALEGTRLAVAANYVNAPGAFLTRVLADLQHPAAERFFSSLTLRWYPKDAVIDVLKGEADVACVDQGTVGALDRFYGIASQVRTLAVSPRYDLDVVYTSLNNLATHRTEIELAQRQLTTLGKDPEGQEVLFFFDKDRWEYYREGDIDVALEHFDDFLRFLDETPVDLKPLLDPQAPVDRRTYDRRGDE